MDRWRIRTQVNYFFQSINLVFVNCFDSTDESNISNSLFDNNFFSFFREIIFYLHYIWLILKFIYEPYNHHSFLLSITKSCDIFVAFFFQDLSHDSKSLFLFGLIFFLSHEIIELNILSIELQKEWSRLIFGVNMWVN